MNFSEFFNHVFNYNFMKNMEEIKETIHKQIEGEDPDEDKENEAYDEEKVKQEITNKILVFVNRNHFPDIINSLEENIVDELKHNNIIYFDGNQVYKSNLLSDSDEFERNTPGAFILCRTKDSLIMVKDEILKTIKKGKRITFNLITTGSLFKEAIEILSQNKDFENCIKNYCIYCSKKKSLLIYIKINIQNFTMIYTLIQRKLLTL